MLELIYRSTGHADAARACAEEAKEEIIIVLSKLAQAVPHKALHVSSQRRRFENVRKTAVLAQNCQPTARTQVRTQMG
jgi:hypothetical protein